MGDIPIYRLGRCPECERVAWRSVRSVYQCVYCGESIDRDLVQRFGLYRKAVLAGFYTDQLDLARV